MRTLLRHTETGLYLQSTDKWTEYPETAYDFRFSERARQFVELWELEKVEVAFAFEDSQSTLRAESVALNDAA